MLKSLLGAFTHTYNVPVALWRRYIKTSSGNNNHHRFVGDFCEHKIKTLQNGSIFSGFNPCPSLSSVVTDDTNQIFSA